MAVTSPLRTERQDPVNRYPPLDIYPSYKRPLAERTQDISEGDVNYGRTVKNPSEHGTGATASQLGRRERGRLGCGDLGVFDDNLLGYDLTNDGYFHGGFRPAFEVTSSRPRGPGRLHARGRDPGTFGHHHRLHAERWEHDHRHQLIGQAATVQTGIDWTGRGDHPAWYQSNNVWTIRLFQPDAVDADDERRRDHAAGSSPRGSSRTSASRRRPALRCAGHETPSPSPDPRGRRAGLLRYRGCRATAPRPTFTALTRRPCWRACTARSARSFRRLINVAGDGHTSVQQFSVLQATDLTGVSDVVLNIGTNDVQNPGAGGHARGEPRPHRADHRLPAGEVHQVSPSSSSRPGYAKGPDRRVPGRSGRRVHGQRRALQTYARASRRRGAEKLQGGRPQRGTRAGPGLRPDERPARHRAARQHPPVRPNCATVRSAQGRGSRPPRTVAAEDPQLPEITSLPCSSRTAGWRIRRHRRSPSPQTDSSSSGAY